MFSRSARSATYDLPIIVRGAIALCSLIFLVATAVAATAPSGDYLGVAALCIEGCGMNPGLPESLFIFDTQ